MGAQISGKFCVVLHLYCDEEEEEFLVKMSQRGCFSLKP